MNYKWHARISLALVMAAAIYILFLDQYTQVEVAAFCLMGIFNTMFASPDIDHPNSTPTKRMGAVGKATSKTFTHRGLLHNPYFWTILYFAIGLYVQLEHSYEAWWLTGGLIAIYTHIILDKVSSKVKRVFNRIKKKLHL